MAHNSAPTSAFLGLLFFGANYFAGFEGGMRLTGSIALAVLIALIMPCLTLLSLAVLMPARDIFTTRSGR